jgi:hypothetical protein
MIVGCWIALGALVGIAQEKGAAPQETSVLSQKLEIEPRKGSGVLALKSALAPGQAFEFVSIEALVDAKTRSNSSNDLYPVKLESSDWKVEGSTASYTWTFPERAKLEFRASVDAAEEGECAIEYTLTNLGKETLERLVLYPCLPTLGVPAFYPGTAEEAVPGAGGRKARVGRNDYTALYERVFLWEDGKRFAFKDSNLAPAEKHLAFMKKGEQPLEWSWFINAERKFDVPLLVATSRDGKQSLGFAIDSTVQASSNCGDGRACLHMVPSFGDVAPGKSVKVSGRIYWIAGTPEDVLARFRADFPKLAKK